MELRDYFSDTYDNARATEANRLDWAEEEDSEFDIDGDLVWRPPGGETEITRDYKGRPYIYPLKDGVVDWRKNATTYTRVTTFIKVLDSGAMIVDWEWRKVIKYLSTPGGETYVLEAASLEETDPKYKSDMRGLISRLKIAAGCKDDARRGTAIHAITERYDMGLDVKDIPRRYQPHLEFYKQITQYFEMVEIEKFCVNDALKTGGTPDRVIRYIPCASCGKDLFIEDLKGGRVDEYTLQQIGMQMALYAHSQIYDIQTGERTPWPDICLHKGVVVHVPGAALDPANEGGRVEWVNIAKGWKNVNLALAVRESRADKKNLSLPFTPRVNVDALLRSADSKNTLRAIYEVHRNDWSPALDARMQRMMEMLP